MNTLSARTQWIIAFVLVFFIVMTRSQHFASLHNLPGATWAMFFLAGIYLRPAWALPALLGLTWFIDFAAFTWGGASDFCLTPAYGMLIPAYSALWFTGRFYARKHRFQWQTLPWLFGSMVVGAAICELFSSGGFYVFSGHFEQPSFAEFGQRLMQYFPAYLQSITFYVACAAVVHALLGLVQEQRFKQTVGE